MREDCTSGESLNYRVHSRAAAWLGDRNPPALPLVPKKPPPPLPPTAGPPTNVAPPKGKPAPPPLPLAKGVPHGEAESKTGRPAAGEKASPPKPPQRLERSDGPSKAQSSSRTGDRSTEEVYTPFFQETEIDWGSDDDRTEAEKKEDEELFRKTQESVEAFLKAPPDLRRALRTQAWKNCCSKLAALRCDFDTRQSQKFMRENAKLTFKLVFPTLKQNFFRKPEFVPLGITKPWHA